jgi:hypothetical protein
MVQSIVEIKPIVINWEFDTIKQVVLSKYLLEILWESLTSIEHLNHKLEHVVVRLTSEKSSASY